MTLALGEVKMLTLICGRTRAGKTTYSKGFKNVLHLDDFGKYPKSVKPCIDEVKLINDDLILDGIFEYVDQRKDLLRVYKGTGKRICIWIDTPLKSIGIRLYGEEKYTDKVLAIMIPFEPPTYDEGWDEIYIVHGNEDILLEK